MKRIVTLLALGLLAAACAPSPTPEAQLPTLAVLPSVTPTTTQTATIPATVTPPPTNTPPATATPTASVTPSQTPAPTNTPRPSATPSVTVNPTEAAVGTATEGVLEAPRFSTLTPAPGGAAVVPGTPQVAADVVITEKQFQERVNQKIQDIPTIANAAVDFVPGGINVALTALGGEAYIDGKVFIQVQLTDAGVAQITIPPDAIQVNAPEPPEGYIQVVNTDFFTMMVGVLDDILKERLGPDQKLKSIVVNNDTIQATILVPQR
jgi:hypothetical protein